jgi:hypothetical protein
MEGFVEVRVDVNEQRGQGASLVARLKVACEDKLWSWLNIQSHLAHHAATVFLNLLAIFPTQVTFKLVSTVSPSVVARSPSS